MYGNYDPESPVADLLMAVLPWVHQEDRDWLTEELKEKFGQDAADMVHDMYEAHRINETGD